MRPSLPIFLVYVALTNIPFFSMYVALNPRGTFFSRLRLLFLLSRRFSFSVSSSGTRHYMSPHRAPIQDTSGRLPLQPHQWTEQHTEKALLSSSAQSISAHNRDLTRSVELATKQDQERLSELADSKLAGKFAETCIPHTHSLPCPPRLGHGAWLSIGKPSGKPPRRS